MKKRILWPFGYAVLSMLPFAAAAACIGWHPYAVAAAALAVQVGALWAYQRRKPGWWDGILLTTWCIATGLIAAALGLVSMMFTCQCLTFSSRLATLMAMFCFWYIVLGIPGGVLAFFLAKLPIRRKGV